MLHFAEIYWGAPGGGSGGTGRRKFHVDIEAGRKLTDFDIFQQAGGAMRPVLRTFPVSVSDGTLSINFIQGSNDFPKISAIEVVPVIASAARQASPDVNAAASLSRGLSMNVYPNPNIGDKMSIDLEGFQPEEQVMVDLVDASGRLIQSIKVFARADGTVESVMKMAVYLKPGMYFVIAYSPTGKIYRKVMVQ